MNMKKRVRKDKLEAFRKAYYAELNKAGVMDSEKEEVVELTRAALMKKAKEMGLEVHNKMTKADLEQLIKEA